MSAGRGGAAEGEARSEAVRVLATAYAQIIRAFALTGLRSLRMPTIAGGIYVGGYRDVILPVTAEALRMVGMMVAAPVQIALGLYLLWELLGLAMLAGLGFMVAIVPLQVKIFGEVFKCMDKIGQLSGDDDDSSVWKAPMFVVLGSESTGKSTLLELMLQEIPSGREYRTKIADNITFIPGLCRPVGKLAPHIN